MDMKKIMSDVMWKLNIKNINTVPKIEKVVVSVWIWSLLTRKWNKNYDEIEKNLQKITWQKPYLIKAKKSVSNFKLREWIPVMLKVTLRRDKAYDFLERFVKIVLPRIRDFSWIGMNWFDKHWNFNIWLKSYDVFSELSPDDITIPMWIQITIVTTTSDNEKAKWLLETLWFIFKK